MANEELDPCDGCTLNLGALLCPSYNDGSCPCTICLMKMMQCDHDRSVNDSCDLWRDWFNKKYDRIFDSKWEF